MNKFEANLPYRSHFMFQLAKYRLNNKLDKILSDIMNEQFPILHDYSYYNYNSWNNLSNANSISNIGINSVISNPYSFKVDELTSAINAIGMRLQDIQMSVDAGSSPLDATYTITAKV